jgi:hypothetical protein
MCHDLTDDGCTKVYRTGGPYRQRAHKLVSNDLPHLLDRDRLFSGA